ncbi:hypothetical protein EDD16DRAFT_1520439 [Pisolithus croceorrhizus]|nr:hypothetical protein EV401DRAFT_1894614 [Pisolithus croceorrhizus]KAI6116619.1 hypothetical protein EDD16DRAFT_1520439 [Pisolithus croceorrhizus]KAI6142557.1 hypothetical protein EDD17DRAFT_1515727 [Pisolithus thermaeus]
MALRRLVVVVISVRSIYLEMDINVWLADYMRGCVLSFSYLNFLAAHHFAVVCSTTSAGFAACKGASPETIVQARCATYLADGEHRDRFEVRTNLTFLHFAHATRSDGVLQPTRKICIGRCPQASSEVESDQEERGKLGR